MQPTTRTLGLVLLNVTATYGASNFSIERLAVLASSRPSHLPMQRVTSSIAEPSLKNSLFPWKSRVFAADLATNKMLTKYQGGWCGEGDGVVECDWRSIRDRSFFRLAQQLIHRSIFLDAVFRAARKRVTALWAWASASVMCSIFGIVAITCKTFSVVRFRPLAKIDSSLG